MDRPQELRYGRVDAHSNLIKAQTEMRREENATRMIINQTINGANPPPTRMGHSPEGRVLGRDADRGNCSFPKRNLRSAPSAGAAEA